ncbi:MAG: hypothetical protein U0L97_02735 [Candidatus Saccharimonadaceae bacterium]|nr:hypothetical protein [Candidatus Saccharimonadaceae bacterium]
MNQNIILPTTTEKTVVARRRRELIVKLESLIWQDVDAIYQLDNYCLNRWNTVDSPTGLFADCLVNIARAVKQLEAALNSWRKNDDLVPIEDILKNVRHAVGFCCT